MTLIDWITHGQRLLQDGQVAFGQGTTNAWDESVWLSLWGLGLPLDTPLDDPAEIPELQGISQRFRKLTPAEQALLASLFEARITRRIPTAYLTREAWLQGVPFYVDERAIIPRSLIAEVIAEGLIDPWLSASTRHVLDLCTGNGSLAVLAAFAWPEVQLTASDLSDDALAVARINIERHHLTERIRLVQSDGLTQVRGPFDLILCNPPYVNAASMAVLPPEFLAEPGMALSGNQAGGNDGMDFIRPLLAQAPAYMTADAVLVLEIGHEQPHFEAAFPALEPVWLPTRAGDHLVLLLTREQLLAHRPARA